MSKRDGCIAMLLAGFSTFFWLILPWFNWRILVIGLVSMVATLFALLIVRPRIGKTFYQRMLVGYLIGVVAFIVTGNAWGVHKALSIIGSIFMPIPFCVGMMIHYDYLNDISKDGSEMDEE